MACVRKERAQGRKGPMKLASRRIAALALAAGLAILPSYAKAGWLFTTPGVGQIELITVTQMHGYWFTTIRLSAPFPNCGANVRDAVIMKRTPTDQVLETHDTFVNVALAAQLAGKPITAWTENLTFTIFGNPVTACVIGQLAMGN